MSLGTTSRATPGTPSRARVRARRSTGSEPEPIPPATRGDRSTWRDPRLWVGLLLVAASVVGGARVLASADDTVAVWAVGTDAGPGARIAPDDLVVHRVRFADDGDLAGYFTVDAELPAELRLVRGVGAGELLPRAAVGSAGTAPGSVELPVAVDGEQVPPSVQAGSVVDVYLVGRGPVLTEATVVAAPPPDATFGSTTGHRQLVVTVPAADAAAFLDALGRSREPVLTVVRRG